MTLANQDTGRPQADRPAVPSETPSETGFAAFDSAGRLVEANPAMLGVSEAQAAAQVAAQVAAMTGAEEQTVLTGVLGQFAPLRGLSGGTCRVAEAVAEWRASRVAVEVQGADGGWRVLSSYARPGGGRCYLVVALAAKLGQTGGSGDPGRAEEPSVDLLRDALESLNAGVGLCDRDDRLVLFNEPFKRLLNPDGDVMEAGGDLKRIVPELVRRGVFVLPDGNSEAAFSASFIDTIRAGAKNAEFPMSDGRILICASHATPLGGHLITVEDITERRRAEQAEHESDMLVRKIVEACPTTFLVSRVSDGKIIYFPETSRDRFGDIESTRSFFLDPKDREKYLAALLPTGVLDDYPVRFRRRDGSVMHGLTSARVTDYKGEDLIVSSTRDITEQLAMQDELERQREIAHQNEKLSALGELLAGVAHELNNPLSIVVGYALMLQDKIDEPALKRRVERIGQAAERCAKIVKTFLAMARQRPARVERCSMNEVVETALDVAGYGLRSAGAQVVLDLDPALPDVDVDPDQMAQVFTNLIVNAEHALAGHGETGRLTLRSYHSRVADGVGGGVAGGVGGEVVVEVRDNGDGVAPEILARIFEPFFTTKDVGAGTGVGLAFCHRIVDSHGGTLTVTSAPGKGASFLVRVKAAGGGAEAAAAAPETRRPAVARRVLVVDDEAGVADLIRDLLEEEGYAVEACNEARGALALMATQRFDAILSDIKMPGLDGEGFLSAVRAASPDQAARIAFVTGDAMSPRVAEFLAGSGQPHLEKPIAPADLFALIERLCTNTQGSKE